MKKIILSTLLCLIITSCATILKKKTYELSVSSDVSGSKVKIYDSIYPLPANVVVERSKEDLNLIWLTSDSIHKDYLVKTSPNSTFLFANLLGFHFIPVTYGIDFTNQKRFYYGKEIFLSSQDTTYTIFPPIREKGVKIANYFKREFLRTPGDMNLVISIPSINGFNMDTEQHGVRVQTGVFGFRTGFDYYYREDKYFNMSLAFSSGRLLFSEEKLNTYYLSLTDNKILHRLNVGYGLNYSINRWKFEEFDEDEPDSWNGEKSIIHAVGLIGNCYLNFNRILSAGVIYKPTFLQVYPETKFQYEHLISIDFQIKIPIKKNK